MFAVFKSGGRQYKVVVGERLEVNRLPVEAGEQVRFEEVLLISDADHTTVGTPIVDDAFVLATATKQGRGEKLIVFKYKSKKRYRHKRGHRQELTFLTVDDIVANGKSLVTGEAPVFKEKQALDAETEEVAEAATDEVETTAEVVEEATEEAPRSDAEKRSRRRRTARTDESEAQASDKAEE